MKFFYLSILILCSISTGVCEKYRIFLKDKGATKFSKGSELFTKAVNSLSERAIQRRLKIFPTDSFVSIEDSPIYDVYINKIQQIGVKILLKLKWLNYVVIEANKTQISEIQKYDFVKLIQQITEKIPKEITHKITSTQLPWNISKLLFLSQTSQDKYGESIYQLKMLNIDKLQAVGILGDSIILGIIDTGFRWKENKIFEHSNVLAEYDFIYNDKVTANESLDTTIQDHHGTMVFSILSGIKDGYLFGSTPFANFVLAKTEDIRVESHFEEDCFAASIEWMDSLGVDVITSSLGYSKFDSIEASYHFEEFDGKTTLVSAYANRAANVGIVMISSAGNKGPRDSSIQAPAEALGEIAIGAVNPSADSVLNFSSRGPTFDGRIKPDFVAQGNLVICSPAHPFDTVTYGNGTSVAAPIFAGGVALLLSTFEELTPETLLNLLKNNATKKDKPNNTWGYGIVDFYNLALDYDIIISPPISFYTNDRQRIVFKINSKNQINYAKIFYKSSSNTEFSSSYLKNNPGTDEYYYDLYPNLDDNLYDIYVVVETIDGRTRRKPFFNNKWYQIKIQENSKNLFVLENSILKIEDFSTSDKIKIYRTILTNSSELIINFGDSQAEFAKVEIINSLGEVISIIKTSKNYSSLGIEKVNLDLLTSGIYFLKITTSNGKTELLKFVKAI
ncbi:MAG: S8 family serine peptidase [Candidatus Kapaibacteriota bacterium]